MPKSVGKGSGVTKNIEYNIIIGNTEQQLANAMNSWAIPQGWRPQGGVFIVVFADKSREYYQAVIREYEGKEPPNPFSRK